MIDGLGETSDVPRPLREGEVAEWILLDGVIIASSMWNPAPQSCLLRADASDMHKHRTSQPLPRED